MKTSLRALLCLLVATAGIATASAENSVWLWIRSKAHGGSLPGMSLSFDHASAAKHKAGEVFIIGIEPHLANRLTLAKGVKVGMIEVTLNVPKQRGVGEAVATVVLHDIVVQQSKVSPKGMTAQTLIYMTAKSFEIKETSATTNRDWNGFDPPKAKEPAQ